MKRLRIISLALATILLASGLMACNPDEPQETQSTTAPAATTTDPEEETEETDEETASDTEGTTEDAGETEAPTTEEPTEPQEVIELSFYNADGQEDPWTDPVALMLTEKTGIRLNTSYPIAQDDQTIALMIAEQNYPDMIFAKGDAGKLIEAGALIDLEPLIEEHAPNIKKLYGDEYDKLRHSKDDPAIYQTSSYGAGAVPYTTSGTAQIQWAALKANDYEIPNTLEKFEQTIKSYLEANPETEDGMSHIGLSLSTADWHWLITLGNPAGFIAEAAPDNGQWLVDEDHNGIYKFRSEKVREYFGWLNSMYHEGILDPDFATQTHEDYIAKIASGRVIALTDADWDYADGERILKADGKYEQTYAPLPLTMTEDQKAPSLMYQGLTTGYGIGISVNCEDPVAAIKFLDYIASDEGQVLVQWGIEDVNYTVQDGKRVRNPEDIEGSQSDPDYIERTGVGFHNYPFPAYGNGVEDSTGNTYTTTNRETVINEYDVEQKAALDAWGVELLTDIFPQPDEFETPPYSAIWAYTKPAQFDEISTRLDEIAWSSLVSLIIDEEANFDANYDKLVSDLESAGMTQAEDMLTEIIAEKVALLEG